MKIILNISDLHTSVAINAIDSLIVRMQHQAHTMTNKEAIRSFEQKIAALEDVKGQLLHPQLYISGIQEERVTVQKPSGISTWLGTWLYLNHNLERLNQSIDKQRIVEYDYTVHSFEQQLDGETSVELYKLRYDVDWLRARVFEEIEQFLPKDLEQLGLQQHILRSAPVEMMLYQKPWYKIMRRATEFYQQVLIELKRFF